MNEKIDIGYRHREEFESDEEFIQWLRDTAPEDSPDEQALQDFFFDQDATHTVLKSNS